MILGTSSISGAPPFFSGRSPEPAAGYHGWLEDVFAVEDLAVDDRGIDVGEMDDGFGEARRWLRVGAAAPDPFESRCRDRRRGNECVDGDAPPLGLGRYGFR